MEKNPQSPYGESMRLMLIELVNALGGILPESLTNRYSTENIRSASDDDLPRMAGDFIREMAAFREQMARHRTRSFQRDFLAITLSNIGDGVITLDDAGRIVLFNKAAEELSGWLFREAEGKLIQEIVMAFDEKNRTAPVMDFIGSCSGSQERKSEFRCMIRSRVGCDHFVACQGFGIREQDRHIGTVLVLRDISQSHLMEEELLKIRKLESVGKLAGGIAHDFNNILTGITTYLFMAKVSVPGNSEAAALISEAEKAAFKATTLTKQLLSFSDTSHSIREMTQVKPLIRNTVGFSLSGSNVDYRIDISDDCALLEIDKGQIDQALHALLTNAVQAMPGGGIVTITAGNHIVEEKGTDNGTIKALPIPNGLYVKISVTDEGIGIPKENLERLYDPYFTTKKECTGLGLTTVYSIVKNHGGYIHVETAEGKGSVFSMYLPAMAPAGGGKTPGTTPGGPRGTGRILIMDDDVIVRTVVATLLKKIGYSPVCTANGLETLEKYREAQVKGEPFLITIMDLTIQGGMGGRETVKKLRESDPDAKVIVFSGYTNDPIVTNYKDHGFDGVLSKPFVIDEFMHTITEILHLRPRETGDSEASLK